MSAASVEHRDAQHGERDAGRHLEALEVAGDDHVGLPAEVRQVRALAVQPADDLVRLGDSSHRLGRLRVAAVVRMDREG